MSWGVGVGSVLALGAGAIAAGTAMVAYRNRERRDSRGFVLLMSAVAVWSLAYAVQLGFTAPAGQLAWHRLVRVAAGAVPTLWLLFCLEYAGTDRWLTRRRQGLLAVEPLVYAAAVLTTPYHGLLWDGVRVAATAAGPVVSPAFEPGYYVHAAYSYALIAAGILVLSLLYVRSSSAYRKQTGLVIVAALSPFAANVAYTLGPAPWGYPGIDPTPFAFAASGVLAGVGLYRFDLLERTPIARRRVLEEMGDGLVVLDPDGRVMEMNSVARQALSPPLAPGEPITRLPFEGTGTVRAALDALEGRSIDVETDDGDRTYDVAPSILTDHRGERAGHVLALRDVTDRAEYRRQSERLEEFADVVSHDLRSPLSVARMAVELAGEECDSDHLAEAEEALDRMADIVEDTLELARQGRVVDDPERVGLSGLADGCWRTVDTAGATLSVEDDLAVRGDPERLRNLLENLFRNAVEHGGDGVTVRVGRLEDGFYVADDGPGIPAGERERVFDSGHSTAEDGTGLGLAIVGRIVEAHGWRIRATESEDGGARFEVTGVELLDPRP